MTLTDNATGPAVLWTTRRAGKPHKCRRCGETINKGERYVRVSTKSAGEWVSIPRHEACASPIPTRPVQKHFSEAGWGRREGGAQWKTLTWWAIAAILFLIAVSGLVASYGGGQ